jgi:hypothetical protein
MNTTFCAHGFGDSLLQMRGLGRQARVSVASLSTSALYQAPSGKLCRLMPRRGSSGGDGDSFSFLYVLDPGERVASDPLEQPGFRFSAANVSLLREVAR